MMWRKLPVLPAGARKPARAADTALTSRTLTDDLSAPARPPRSEATAEASFHFARHRWLGLVNRDALLTGGTVRVAIYLWEHQNAKRGCAWPALETISKDLKLNKSTVTRGIKALKQREWINVRHRGGRFRSNEYRLMFGSMDDDK